MMMKKLILIISILFSSAIFAQQSQSKYQQEMALKMIQPQIAPITQAALDLAELQKYFHSKSVVFSEEAPFNAENLKVVTKFNKPIEVLKPADIAKKKVKKYLSINDWDITMNDCKLELNFIGEGILISYTLRKTNNKWIVTSFQITPKK